MVVAPKYKFVLARSSVPAPDLVSPPAPEMLLATLTVFPLATSMVLEELVVEIGFEMVVALVPVSARVPPASVKPPDPSLCARSMDTVPEEIVVVPL